MKPIRVKSANTVDKQKIGKDMIENLNHLTINFSAFETGKVRSAM